MKDKKYCKVRDHCYYTGEYKRAANSICNLKYSLSKKILIAFHNRSDYDLKYSLSKKILIAFHNRSDYDLTIIKNLVKEFEKQFTCLEENTENYITFTVPVEEKVTRIDKNGEEITKKHSTDYNLLIVQDFLARS